MLMNRDNFDSYKNLSEYWLKEDALRSLDYDVYFSLGIRYYCDAGCKVCYIKKVLYNFVEFCMCCKVFVEFCTLV